MTKTRKPVDWSACEADYRTGTFSNPQLAKIYGCTEGAIRARVKKYEWRKDLSEQVRRETAAKLLREDLRTDYAIGDAAIINDGADIRVKIVRQHRDDIRSQRDLIRSLIGELRHESESEAREAILNAIDKDSAENRTKAAMRRAVSLPSRASVMRDLAMAGKVLVELERQAFSLDEPKKPDAGHPVLLAHEMTDDELASIAGRRRSGTSDPAES